MKRTVEEENPRRGFLTRFFRKSVIAALYRALKITVLYLLVGCLWILLSDALVETRFRDRQLIFLISTAKGWIYVLITAVLFFLLIYRELKKTIRSKEETEKLNTQLEKSNVLFSAILESSPEVIVFAIDRQYRYSAFNKKHSETMLRLWKKRIAIGDSILEVIQKEDDRRKAKRNFDRALGGEAFSMDEGYDDEDLCRFYWQNYYSPIRSGGDILGATVFSINITALKSAEAEKQFLSDHDKLTGLYNRRFYEDALIRINEDGKVPVSVILGDVNGLKLVNDAFGHVMGDELLKLAAEAALKACRPGDIPARWGGDEFIILLPNAGAKASEEFIARAKEGCAKVHINSIRLDISFGWSVKTSPDEDFSQVIKNAENFMYSQKMTESKSMRSQTIQTILQTLHEKNPREAEHSKRVGEISRQIGVVMGYTEAQTRMIYLAGYLHDIGKIAIEEGILNKPGKLSEEEFETIKKHPEIGCRIIRSSYEFSEIAEVIQDHHERWDGTGYPNGLKGDEIPLYSRIIAIADSYDAMTSERTYKKSLTSQDAVAEIADCAGRQFDPEISRIFVESVMHQGRQ